MRTQNKATKNEKITQTDKGRCPPNTQTNRSGEKVPQKRRGSTKLGGIRKVEIIGGEGDRAGKTRIIPKGGKNGRTLFTQGQHAMETTERTSNHRSRIHSRNYRRRFRHYAIKYRKWSPDGTTHWTHKDWNEIDRSKGHTWI